MSQRQEMNRSAHKSASRRVGLGAALACIAGALPYTAGALPVIPNAAGYGIETPAGRGGKVYKVTNLNASGAGSLRACVDASGPRVCVFEVSGTIRADVDLIVRNPYITIAGQTAPSPGVLWRGGALWVATSNVLVQHMRFRAGDDPKGPGFANRDALKVGYDPAAISNVVVDHCSFSWATDEVASVWTGYDNITLSNNIISEGLYQSHLPSGATGGMGLIVGEWKGRVAIIGNLMAHTKERNPLVRATQAVIINNVVYNRMNMDVDLQSDGTLVTNTAVVGNVFIRGADYARSNKPVLIRTGGASLLPSASKVYVADNAALETSANDDWSVVGASIGGDIAPTIKTGNPPTWPAGLTRLPTDSDVVLNQVLKRSGARPADRDPVDKRVVQSVRDRSGRIINCVSADGSERCSKNAGGWPVLAENHRTLTPPANPSGTTPSGYTNLEVWLHKMSAEVEGRSGGMPTAPVLAKDQ
jgi:pectate lyase